MGVITQQCSRCTDVAGLVSVGEAELVEVARVLGVNAPALHVHLVQHGQDALMREMTYKGSPIIPKLEETTVVAQAAPEPEPVPSLSEDTEPQVDAQGGDTNEWPEDVDPQEFVDAGLITDDGLSFGDYPTDVEITSVLAWLGAHEASHIRDLAHGLLKALEDHAQSEMDRIRLEELVAQRDALNAQIDELARSLGDLEQEAPAAPSHEVEKRAAADVPAATIRTWCIAHNVDVPARGTLPKKAVEAYMAAHEGAQ